jgi:hypothetical protein
MRNGTDPSWHRAREREFIEHAEKLLEDDRLRLSTARGKKPITLMLRKVTKVDRGGDLKRMMSEMGKRDRELQDMMPVGESLDVELLHKWLWVMKSVVGRLRVVSVPPTRDLLQGHAPPPLDRVRYAALANIPARAGNSPVPETVVVFSSAGFAPDMVEASRAAGNYLILVEPNDSGGFNVMGSPELKDIVNIFDPEAEQQKRQRVTDAIAAQAGDLTGSGIAVDRLAKQTELPMQLVEAALKSYAREHAGLVAKKLDGRLVLFREGSTGTGETAGGSSMPMIDRIRALFGGRGENEKKIAFLSERRTALGQQRDRVYNEVESFEKKELDLSAEFAAATKLGQQKIAIEIARLRADASRRREFLMALEKQLDVVNEGLHTLEMNQQLAPSSLEKLAAAARPPEGEGLEQGLATLDELHESVPTRESGLELPDSAQAVLEELQQRTQTVKEPAPGSSIAGASQTATGKTSLPPIPPLPEHNKERKRSEPEAG